MHRIAVEPATIQDKAVVGRLFELYAHDFSEFEDADVDDHGLFGYRYLDDYWTEPERHPFLFRVDNRLAGFALVHSGSPHDMAEFFVMRKYRRRGIGARAAQAVFARFPGEWQVRELATNPRATAFWRTAIPAPSREDFNDDGPVQHFVIAERADTGEAN